MCLPAIVDVIEASHPVKRVCRWRRARPPCQTSRGRSVAEQRTTVSAGRRSVFRARNLMVALVAHCGPSRDDHCTRAFRPIATSRTVVCYDCSRRSGPFDRARPARGQAEERAPVGRNDDGRVRASAFPRGSCRLLCRLPCEQARLARRRIGFSGALGGDWLHGPERTSPGASSGFLPWVMS
jgi:hypothetical protein